MYGLMTKLIAWGRSRPCRGGGPAPRARLCLEALETRVVPSGNDWSMYNAVQHDQAPYLQTNLVSDLAGQAEIIDSSLKNPWGVSLSATGPFWVSNQVPSNSTFYAVTSAGVTKVNLGPGIGSIVSIPRTTAGLQGPTGQVFNSTSDFVIPGGTMPAPALFIFDSLNGTISAWNFNSGSEATIVATTPGAVYTGLAIGSNAAGNFLYAANDAGPKGSIDVFDSNFAPVSPGTDGFGSNPFVDPSLPAGLVPFNVQNIGGNIYVTYAPSGHDAQTGATEGQGAVAIFDTSGKFIKQLIAGGKLAAPWGITRAPAGFGEFGGDLLVGNFAYSDSVINAFNPTTGKYLGTLTGPDGRPLSNPGLWALTFGNGVSGDRNTLYFTAGINDEMDGLFGSIQPVPSLSPRAPVVPNLPAGAEQTFPTMPVNGFGDQNPYGVAFVPQGFTPGGKLHPGDILVSNFNNRANLQGTGSTIVRFTPDGGRSVFFQGQPGQPGLGLTGALGVLKSGFVLVGSLPTTDGTAATIGTTSLLILDSSGNVVKTLAGNNQLIDGPWFLAVNDQGARAQVFVSNVLSGTVTRIDLRIPTGGNPVVESMTQIASGYAHRADPDALVVGPAGLAYDAARDVLYVASTADNAIYAISKAAVRRSDQGKGQRVVHDNTHLHGPLGLVLAPNGDLIVSNGDAVNPDPNHSNELVEFTPKGKFVGQFQLDKGPASGAAFGIALSFVNGELRFAAVDNNTNTLNVWTFETAATRVTHHGHHHHKHHHEHHHKHHHEHHRHESGDDDDDDDCDN